MKRRKFLKTLATATVAATTLPSWLRSQNAPHISKRPRPNILLISADQWHAETFSHRGNHFLRTPNSDRIAATSTCFESAYAAHPVCTPARCSWMTGRMPTEHRSRPPADMPDFGQWFSANDYETVHLGKWDVPGHNVRKSFKLAREGWTLGQYSDPAIAQLASGYLLKRRNNHGSPFLMHVAFMNPHDICQPSVMLTQRGQLPLSIDKLPPLPDNFSEIPSEPDTFIRNIRQGRKRANLRDWTETDWRFYIWLYHRYCEQVDVCIGQVLDALDAGGESENTLLVFTSDHGEGAGHHALYTKGFLYEESVRVPFYMRHPTLPVNKNNRRELISGIDLFPTFCAAAGIPAPKNLPGQDILAACAASRGTREAVVAQVTFNGRMVRTDRHKFIRYENDSLVQLFDLQADPLETNNLATQPGNEAQITRHQKLLADFESRLNVV